MSKIKLSTLKRIVKEEVTKLSSTPNQKHLYLVDADSGRPMNTDVRREGDMIIARFGNDYTLALKKSDWDRLIGAVESVGTTNTEEPVDFASWDPSKL